MLNTNTLQQQLFVPQTVLPYTFTTGELDALKAKLQNAENQMLNNPKQEQISLLQMSISEILTLLKMIDMTYLQGLSGTGVLQGLSSHEVSSTSNGKHPPSNYVCRKCHIPGHFIQDCPNSSGFTHQKNQNGPPLNYVCRKCHIGGHWIQDCTMNQQQDFSKPPPNNYTCHRCGMQGHWIKSCPTNGNPNYDNKHHMSTSSEDHEDNNEHHNENNNNNNNDDNNNSNNNDNNNN